MNSITFRILFFLSFTPLAAISQSIPSKVSGNDKPFVLGTITSLHSNILNEDRTLNVYLPEGYNSHDTIKYPVIYLLDGSADEDFIHVAGLVQFNSFPWVNRLPKSIVVGIANVDRKRDFTYPSSIQEEIKNLPTSGHSQSFINFIEKELQPFIQNKFKSNQTRTIIGESLGGLLAAEILLKRPWLFNKYIIISPSIWWDNGSLLDLKPHFENLRNMEIYVGVGKEGLTPGKNQRVMEVDANLLADKFNTPPSKNVKVFFDYLPLDNHATVAHQALMNAFKLLNQ